MSTDNDYNNQSPRLTLQWLNHLLDEHPHDPALWFEKAIVFEEALSPSIPTQTLLERTLLWFHQCHGPWEMQWAAYFNTGLLLRRLNRHSEALLYFMKAYSLNPTYGQCRELLEATLVRLGVRKDSDIQAGIAAVQNMDLTPPHQTFKELPEVLRQKLILGNELIGNIYKDREKALEMFMQGEIGFVMEMADPELTALEFDVLALIDLDLTDIAENICIQYQLSNGHNSLIDSLLARIGLFEKDHKPGIEEQEVINAALASSLLHPESSILDQFSNRPFNELRGVANTLRNHPSFDKVLTFEHISKYDDVINWSLETIANISMDVANPSYALEKIPRPLYRIQAKAILNFLMALRKHDDTLLAYTAYTLSTFYQTYKNSKLPYILASFAAKHAAKAMQADYCLSAHGRCALILIESGNQGRAIGHLVQTLPFADFCKNKQNIFQLYVTLSECYSQFYLWDRAIEYLEKAVSFKEIPAHLVESAQTQFMGLRAIAENKVGNVGCIPVLVNGLDISLLEFDGPAGMQVFQYTSKHELYDSLLQLNDHLMAMAQTLFDRETLIEFLRKIQEISLLTTLYALEIGLLLNALLHIESNKAILLRNRLKYLPVIKPQEIPEPLWNQLNKLTDLYRDMIESPHSQQSSIYMKYDFGLHDITDHIKNLLWKTSLYSSGDVPTVSNRLTVGNIPSSIRCSNPEKTLILSFWCGPQYGVCFFIRATDCSVPEVIRIPNAAIPKIKELCNRFDDVKKEILTVIAQKEIIDKTNDGFLQLIDVLTRIFHEPIQAILKKNQYERLCLILDRNMYPLPIELIGFGTPEGPLCITYDTVCAPSIAILDTITGHPKQKAGSVFIVSDPVPECLHDDCHNPRKDCFCLNGARKEGLEIQEFFEELNVDSTVLSGNDATISNVCEGMNRADIVHIASHGFFQSQNLDNIGILLAHSEEPAASSFMYLNHDKQITRSSENAVGDILTLNYIWKHLELNHCALLNLSACSTGVIDWKEQSDEFYGLSNGFLCAGAKSVLTTLWPVFDSIAPIYNKLFYQSLFDFQFDCVKALKESKKKFISLTMADLVNEPDVKLDQIASIVQVLSDLEYMKQIFEHPIFWGCYRLIGGI